MDNLKKKPFLQYGSHFNNFVWHIPVKFFFITYKKNYCSHVYPFRFLIEATNGKIIYNSLFKALLILDDIVVVIFSLASKVKMKNSMQKEYNWI